MIPTGFLFLLLLTGGNPSSLEPLEFLDAQQKSNHSFEELPGGNTSSFEVPELLDDQQKSNHSFEEMPGGNTSLELPELRYGQQSNDKDDWPWNSENCSYHHFLNYLNLSENKNLYSMLRPVRHHKITTELYLKMVIYAILDVREKDQAFVPYIWIYLSWHNHHIQWDPTEFCGLESVEVPTELMWKPDINIEEMTERDKTTPAPFMTVNYDGMVELRNDLVVVSTCRMRVYQFPFDKQSCTLSFKSVIYSDEEIWLYAITNSSKITEWSCQAMRTQYEWLFINMTVTRKTVNYFNFNQSMIVYTITMRRRSALYIINFILPVLFFLGLDLASFLISHSGGEKLSFKVTVLLAVTVMQLILNEILPASSNRIPLIAIYCIGIFALMLVSLLETIFVMYLMKKDNETDRDQALNVRKHACCAFCCAAETPSQVLSVAEEHNSGQLTVVSHYLEKDSDELRQMEKTQTLISSNSSTTSRNEEEKPGYWTRMAKKINKVFFIFYVTVVSVFLFSVFSMWNITEATGKNKKYCSI
ncbi:5-hydroxytryptamine receptor 3C isoform X2 [Lates calcarifer]|uniref:5-hydroxytryptamine receptor 3C isoform X1 n=3 Tax=Lates calcarifer TaxID=8187 RepID=A0AAJ8AY59_LATCA|nr:5-hydroxytryptamine receptor 3C isoform X1 [Lates calcarifer]XP_050922494.1 5-hydroxytryptamine receptor 3C isoform X2 [Lates calcarifer]